MEFALNYARMGFPVFPVYEPNENRPYGHSLRCSCGKELCKGKHPRTPNGCMDATIDENIIREWWGKWPRASIGGVTGTKSGFSVVDLDGMQGIESGRRLGLRSPIVSFTGSGQQLFYGDENGELKNSVKKLSAGVDIRGEGGYVVLPPSLHPNGKRYVWATIPLSRSALIPFPQSLMAQESKPFGMTSTLRKPSDWIADALEDMRKGHVHNTLVSVLGKFRSHNFSEEDTYRLLQPHVLFDGKPYEGLRAKIAEIWKRYQPSGIAPGVSKSESIDAFLDDVKEVDWICKPFIAKKSIGFVAGLPETMKTWLCADLAVECARGDGMWLGLFPALNCKTLFIDQERWKGETQRRFSAILAAKGIQRSQIKDSLYLKSGTTIRLNIDSSYQAFRTELMEMRPELVIVDSFATFHTVPENDRSEIQKVLERVKELRNEIGCTFLFINHETKMAYPNGEPQGEPTPGTMAGSIGIPAAAEFMLTVRKVEDGTSMVWHTKSTLAQKAKPFYASVVDVPEGIVVRGVNG